MSLSAVAGDAVVGEAVVVTLNHEIDQRSQKRLFCFVLAGKAEDAVTMLAEKGHLMTEDEVVDQAYVLRNLSEKRCFFCGEDNPHQTGWFFHPDKESMSWSQLALSACYCLDEFRTSRITVMAGWEKKLKLIHKKVGDKTMAGSRVLYTDKCSESGCGRSFKVIAQNVYIGMETNGTFRGWTRCPPCVRKRQQALEARGPTFITARPARKNALAPPVNPHAAAHGWGALGDNPSIQEALEKFKKGG